MKKRTDWPHLTDAEISAPNFLEEMLEHNAKYCRGARRDWSKRVLTRCSASIVAKIRLMSNETWSLDDITAGQKNLLALVLNINGCGCFDVADVDPDAGELVNIGLIEMDSSSLCEAGKVYVRLTKDGLRWGSSLPEGALAS